MTDQNFSSNFLERPLKEHFCEIISKSDLATRVFDGIKFCEQVLKRTSQGTFLPSLVQIGPTVTEENMFEEIVDDAGQTKNTGPP